MASSYTTSFGIEKIGSGEQSGTWGTTTNYNLDLLDRIAAYTSVALSGTTHTLTVREASPDSGTENLQDGMYRVIKFTGALGANNTVTIAPNTTKAYFIVENATTDSGSSGPYSVVLSQGSGANVTLQNGKNAIIYCDGAGSGAVVYNGLADVQFTTLEVTGAAAIDGAATFSSTVTVGVDDTGYDVKFFGATSGAYMLWDESADDLKLVGAAGLTVAGDIDVDGTTNLDAVDIDGAVQVDNTVTVGVDDTGYDVKLFGATSGRYWLWDESADGVVQLGTLTVGVDDTGHDVKFFGATSGKSLLWDESADSLIVTGSTSAQGTLTVGVDDTGYDVKLFGATSGKYWLWDESADGVVQYSTLTVGVDDTGHDVKFFGATSGAYLLWDESADDLILAGAAGLSVAGGSTLASVDVTGVATAATFEPDGDTSSGDNAAIGYTSAEGLILTGQGTTNDVTIKNDADTTIASIPTSTNFLRFGDSRYLSFGDSDDLQIYHDATNSYIRNATGALKIATEASGIAVTIGHTTSEVTVADNLTVTGSISVDDTTDTTSGETGSIHTDGGLGVAKSIFGGANLDLNAGAAARSALNFRTGLPNGNPVHIYGYGDNNSGGASVLYGHVYLGITGAGAGAESGSWFFNVRTSGSNADVFTIAGSGVTTTGAVSAATVAGGMLASKAEMEAASATDHLVSPGLMNDHPGMMKCWVSFNQVTPAILAEHNTSSVTDTATGRSKTVWDVDFSAATYATGGTAMAAVANHGVEQIAGDKATTGCGYACKNFATNTDGDTADLNIWAAGDQ